MKLELKRVQLQFHLPHIFIRHAIVTHCEEHYDSKNIGAALGCHATLPLLRDIQGETRLIEGSTKYSRTPLTRTLKGKENLFSSYRGSSYPGKND